MHWPRVTEEATLPLWEWECSDDSGGNSESSPSIWQRYSGNMSIWKNSDSRKLNASIKNLKILTFVHQSRESWRQLA